ncbi:hypothetical protein K439DRAFT_1612266 [Ramaria rubella]|nr:hypothetical protein K439DRAFT_1612266 [Ramaria rubella]
MANVYSHVSLPSACHNHLPTFLLYSRTHPLWPNRDSYVYEWDTDIDEQKSYFQWAKSRSVEVIYEQYLDRAGEMRLYPGQAVFACKKVTTADADPKKDVIQAYVTDESMYPVGFKDDELLPACDRILGDMREHSSDRSKMVGGQLHGKTTFEHCQDHANPIDSGSRCHRYMPLATHKSRDLETHYLNYNNPDNTYWVLHGDIHNPPPQVITASVNREPCPLPNAICPHASVVGSPNFSVGNNVHLTNCQLNSSKSYKHENAAVFKEETHFVGEMHVDLVDQPAHSTNLTLSPDLHSDH